MTDYANQWPPKHEEYPRMLYRAGSAIVWEGRSLDTLTVNDDDELAEAMDAGWATGPEAPKPFSLLDESVAVIIEHLPALNVEELKKLHADETAGKTRKSVIGALDKALAALTPPPE